MMRLGSTAVSLQDSVVPECGVAISKGVVNKMGSLPEVINKGGSK